jgi:hypothetical protein
MHVSKPVKNSLTKKYSQTLTFSLRGSGQDDRLQTRDTDVPNASAS